MIVVSVSALLFGAVAPTTALEWRGQRSVSGNVILTDNIGNDDSAQNEMIVVVSPQVSAVGVGAHSSAAVSYRLNAFRHLRGTQADTISHQLEATGSTEPVREFFTITGRAGIRQEATGFASAVSSSDGVSGRGDITDVYTFSVNPRLRRRLGNFAQARAGYTLGASFNPDAEDGDTLTHAIDAGLSSGTKFDRVSWDLSYSLDFADSQDDDSTFQRARADIDIAITGRIGLLAGIGYEQNDTDSEDADDNDLSGATGRLGLRFSPSRRTRLEAGADYRAFGVAPFISLEHSRRRLNLRLRVDQDVTTSSRDQINRDFENIDSDEDTNRPVVDPATGGIIDVPSDTLRQGSEVVVTQTVSGTAVYSTAKTTVTLNTNYADREFRDTDENEKVFSVGLTGTQRLSRKWSASASTRYQRTETNAADDDDSDRIEVGLQATRNFATNFSGTASFRHLRRSSAGAGEDFNENRLTIGASYSF